jgi:hypothetical protein
MAIEAFGGKPDLPDQTRESSGVVAPMGESLGVERPQHGISALNPQENHSPVLTTRKNLSSVHAVVDEPQIGGKSEVDRAVETPTENRTQEGSTEHTVFHKGEAAVSGSANEGVAANEDANPQPSENDQRHQADYEQVKESLARRIKLLEDRLPGRIATVEEQIATFAERRGRELTDEERARINSTVTMTKAAIQTLEAKEGYLRPTSDEDLAYRLRVTRELPKAIGQAAPDEVPLRFHGAPIYAAEEIIHSGGISSSVDRLGGETSMDGSGYFSVTTADDVRVSLEGYLDIGKEGNCLPIGCLFVVTPESPEDAEGGRSMVMGNVDFSENPDRLVKVVTSPESMGMVKRWMSRAGMDPGKVTEFFSYPEELQDMKARIASGELDPQDMVPYQLP